MCIRDRNVFEYILQPAPYAKIADAVQRAMQSVRQARADRRMTEYGQEYVLRKRTFTAAALWTWLTGTQAVSYTHLGLLLGSAKVSRKVWEGLPKSVRAT